MLGAERHAARREALGQQPSRVRLRDLEHVERRIQLHAHGAERRDRLVERHEPAGQAQLQRVDEIEALADHLDRIDVRQARAVVAVVQLLDRRAQLVLTLFRVAEPELGQPARQRIDVLGGGVDEEACQPGHVLVGEAPRQPEVDETDAAVVEQQDVRRVRIAVEEAVAEDHRHPGVRHPVRKLTTLFERPRLEIEIRELRALEVLEREHARPRVAPDHLRHHDLVRIAEVAAERLGIPGFVVVVELLAHRPCELVDERLGVDEVERPHALADDARRGSHQLQVRLDLPGSLRPLHLDDDLFAGRQGGAVHLPDRRRGDRPFLEREERLLDREVELALDHTAHLVEGERSDVVLQAAQLGDDVRRDHIGPRREQLAELDERRPELVQHLAQPPPAVGKLRVVIPPAPVDEVAEAVPRGDAADLREPADPALRAHGAHRFSVAGMWRRRGEAAVRRQAARRAARADACDARAARCEA